MQLVKSTTSKKINELQLKSTTLSLISIFIFSSVFNSQLMAQDNSPYSRYGIGDLSSSTNINSRSMGSVAATISDPFVINFSNPASYSSFQSFKEQRSKKQAYGRAVLDIGLNLDSRTLKSPAQNQEKFVAKNLLVSHVQVGFPIKPNWGVSFGLRPISRISYKIGRSERLFDPQTGQPIDSAYTRYVGDGGAYLAAIGTGLKVYKEKKNGIEMRSLSVGFNFGYLFGRKDYSTERILLNDTVGYNNANFKTKTNYGGIRIDAGLQYKYVLNVKKRQTLSLGLFGNLQQKISTTQDIIKQTYLFDEANGQSQLDSVYAEKDVKGKIIYPTSYTIGFAYEKEPQLKEAGFLVAVDFMQTKWNDYRFYNMKDELANKWELRVGTQLRPIATRNYFSNVAYRVGFFVGPDYVKAQNKTLNQYGISFGFGLPVANFRTSFQSINQAAIINLGFEYIKRGNNNNLLMENMFRISLGFSLSDIWFVKRKYD